MKPRSSCDACHLRKTKCDLGERIAEAPSNGVETVDDHIDLSCSFCLSLGVPCRVTKKKGNVDSASSSKAPKKGRHKKGKLIRELLATAAQEASQVDTQSEDVSPDTQEGIQGVDFNTSTHIRFDPTDGPTNMTESGPVHASAIRSTTRSKPCLLGIVGLSTVALEACLKGYLENLALWMPMTEEADVLMKRYYSFLRSIQGLEMEAESESNVTSLPPLSALLVLAVAVRGAPYTAHAHLEKAMTERASSIARDADSLGPEDLDGMEAVVLLAERSTRPLHSTCTTLDPFGKGFSAELCLFNKLNEESPIFAPDYDRRNRLFWTIFCHDALRSASACRMYRLHDEDVGWPMRILFHRQPIICLALMARKLCRTMLSSRARCLGIEASDIVNLLDDLASWPETVQIPIEVVETPGQSSTLPHRQSSYTPSSSTQSGPDVSPQQQQHQSRVKNCIVIGLWLRLTLSVWTALHEVGYLASSEVMARVEAETARAANRMLRLAEVCLEYNLVDYGPNALLTTSAAWLLYLVRKLGDVRATASDSVASSLEVDRLLNMAQVLLKTVRSAKTRPEAEALAQRLEAMLEVASPVPLAAISSLAESSTASMQGIGGVTFQKTSNTSSDMPASSKRKRQTAEKDESRAPPLRPGYNHAEISTTSQGSGFGSNETLINRADYLQTQQQSSATNTNSTSVWPGSDQNSIAQAYGSPVAVIPKAKPTTLPQRQVNDRLAPGYPTGLGVAGDEDYLNFMAVCGFDMQPQFLQMTSR